MNAILSDRSGNFLNGGGKDQMW